jgi:hypothetical protein
MHPSVSLASFCYWKQFLFRDYWHTLTVLEEYWEKKKRQYSRLKDIKEAKTK